MEISSTGANPTTTGWHDYEFLYNSTDTAVNDALSANNGGNSVTIAQGGDESAWSNTGGGSWGTAANWNNGLIPQNRADIADFTGAITANSVITLDGSRTVGQINFNNANSYTLAAGNGGELTLDNGANLATINDANGSHTISAPVILNSNVSLEVQNPGDTLAISGPISGGGAVLVYGLGTVSFGGSNTYAGPTTVNEGTLIAASAGALPAGGSVLNNASLSIQAGTAAAPAIIAGLTGSGTLTVGTAGSPAGRRLICASPPDRERFRNRRWSSIPSPRWISPITR
jgi:autotransporter-associated beta strand protein